MFRANIKLNERTEIDIKSAALRKNAERSRMSNAAVESLMGEFAGIAAPLVEAGRLMQAQGSSFNVTRTIKGAGYDVKLEFATGNNLSFFARLKSFFVGH